MSKPEIVTLHFHHVEPYTETLSLLGKEIVVRHAGCDKSLDLMAEQIAALDGTVAAIALQGVTRTLQLGKKKITHNPSARLFLIAQHTPVVDGMGVRATMERWAIRLAADAQPGIWSRKRILMTPAMNHYGLAQAFTQYTDEIRYADPFIYFPVPDAPGMGRTGTLPTVANPTLAQLKDFPPAKLYPTPHPNATRGNSRLFQWADILAGDMGVIRCCAPHSLKHKIIVAEFATSNDIGDLAERGAMMVITTMPPLNQDLSHHCAATFEACLVALRPNKNAPLTENTYLNLMADLPWQPGIQFIEPEAAKINRFAFVIHPLAVEFIHKHPWFRWTRLLPNALVEWAAAYIPPFFVSKIKGIESPATGQKVEGYLITLGATPKELMRRDTGFVYRRLIRAARMAERYGARIMGLGAFTSVVGDAGITVAQKADIAITSGNSLTVAATLETAKQAAVKMGTDLKDVYQGKVMVIGATGSIGSVCSRLLAMAVPNITLVAPRPEKLIQLKRTIEAETPNANVTISTSADEYVSETDLIVTTTSALNMRIVDITQCKPGAVICDIARPPDITAAEAALRPDVLVIESGEILLPGNPDFGYDIGLPSGVAYACLAETALLAMEGRFEDYTVGRNIEVERVKEIYRLFKKHGLQLSGLRSHGHFLTDEDITRKRALADNLRQHPEKLQAIRTRQTADTSIANGTVASVLRPYGQWALALGTATALVAGWFLTKHRSRQ